jgi:methylated-DNA-[protein]-cysteine S-methyltransferase
MPQSRYQSPIGTLLLTSDGSQINAVSFTSETDTITDQADEIIDACKRQLDEYFLGTRQVFDLPISQAGTEFQQKVWHELERIPFGKTISYHELSKRLGNTKAIRAAGTANGKNQVAIIVPCHRVIGSNGSLVGYAGELWRKKWLLDHEATFSHGLQKLF